MHVKMIDTAIYIFVRFYRDRDSLFATSVSKLNNDSSKIVPGNKHSLDQGFGICQLNIYCIIIIFNLFRFFKLKPTD